jgi:hypothetical protein
MSANQADVYKQLAAIETQQRKLAAMTTELRAMLASGAMSRRIEDRQRCPKCQLQIDGARAYATHLEAIHGITPTEPQTTRPL